MAHTKSGVLHLTKGERNALEVLKKHVLHDISYHAGGTFAKDAGMSEEVDAQEVKKAQMALEVIDFIIQITD